VGAYPYEIVVRKIYDMYFERYTIFGIINKLEERAKSIV